MEYDPEIDIRHYYRMQIKAINAEIQARGRRDPQLHRLYADRKILLDKLASLSTSHTEPTGAMAAYGTW